MSLKLHVENPKCVKVLSFQESREMSRWSTTSNLRKVCLKCKRENLMKECKFTGIVYGEMVTYYEICCPVCKSTQFMYKELKK